MGRVVIVGGGIAGVALARALARRGRDTLLLEREPVLGAGSSGRNAAMFRLAVAEPVNVRLALRSRAIAAEVVPGGVVRDTGALFPCTDEAQQAAIVAAGRTAGVRAATAADRPPVLRPGDRPAVFSPHDGVIDVHALVQGLARDAAGHGAELRTGAHVDALDLCAGAVRGVFTGGERLGAEVVVDATGAWSPRLRGAEDTDVGVRPHRRHLFVLDTPAAARLRGIVWDLAEGIYVRPESGGLLASPCDETAMAAGDGEVPLSEEAPALLFEKLERWAPLLADAAIRRRWAGLRPLTPDHRFVVGPDPVRAGLFRLGGFGGHGMTAGAAAGELAAQLLCGEQPALAAELAPARFSRAAAVAKSDSASALPRRSDAAPRA